MPSQPNMIIELCDKIYDQHIRDDDNSYKELEFDWLDLQGLVKDHAIQ